MIITRKHVHLNEKYTTSRCKIINQGTWKWKITKYKINNNKSR